MRVLVTGSASCLAQALLPALANSADISAIVGVDRRRTAFRHPKLCTWRMDIRDPRLQELVAGCQAVVHLAWVVLRNHMPEREMYAINVAGSSRLFDTAGRHGARIIHVSSAAVYGQGERLTEGAPFDPIPGFVYAAHKCEVEEYLARCHPGAVVLRPHAILGPQAQPLLRLLLRQPFLPRFPAPEPRYQCVHERDVAAAILSSLFQPVTGPFNLAGDPPFGWGDVVEMQQRVALPIRADVFQRLAAAGIRLFGVGGEPAWISGLSRTLTLDCSRAHGELGWTPAARTRDTLRGTH